jgi:hypothetical protein
MRYKMANFDNGIKGFVQGVCEVKVEFPIDWNGKVDVKCTMCKMFNRNSGTCQITKELTEYPSITVGSKCPLMFTGEVTEILNNKGDKR